MIRMTEMILMLLLPLVGAEINLSQEEEEEPFDYRCVDGLQSLGVSLPRGDNNVLVGSPAFPISCHLHPDTVKQGYTARDISFVMSTDYFNLSKKLEPEITGENSIQAMFNPDMVDKFTIDCMLNLKDDDKANQKTALVCRQTLSVGGPPGDVENFKCISENWENLNCTWTEPFNPIRTKYSVAFKSEGKYSPKCCVFAENILNPRQKSCLFNSDGADSMAKDFHLFFGDWNQIRKPGVLRPFETNDTVECLTGQLPCRCFGKYLWPLLLQVQVSAYDDEFDFNLLNSVNSTAEIQGLLKTWELETALIVRPGPVKSLTINEKSPTTLSFSYGVPTEISFFPPGLVHEIKYRVIRDEQKNWNYLPKELSKNNTMRVELVNLIPWTTYELSVRLLSGQAAAVDSEEQHWGDSASIEAQTQATQPYRGPHIHPASFEVIDVKDKTRSVYLFWESMDVWERNGPDFDYFIDFPDSQHGVVDAIDTAYARIRNIPVYESVFRIHAVNQVGKSRSATTVRIPDSAVLQNTQPRNIVKKFSESGVYEITWRRPLKHANLVNYTIFWCPQKRDRPFLCTGKLSWSTVPATQREPVLLLNLNASLTYQAAVAANFEEHSSGMVWAACTVIQGSKFSKLKPLRTTTVSARSVVVEWTVNCVERVSSALGFEIHHCSLPDQYSGNCSDNHIVEVEEDVEAYTLLDLKPFSYYKVMIKTVTKEGSSDLSDPVIVRTLPAAPDSPPVNLTVQSTKPNQTLLSWSEPEILNGDITEYQVYLRENEHSTEKYTSKKPDYQLHLDPYTLYSVQVAGCTGRYLCGPLSRPVIFRTDIGRPAVPPKPTVIFRNSTLVTVSWDTRFKLGAPLPASWNIRVWRAEEHWMDYQHFSMKMEGDARNADLNLETIQVNEDWSPTCGNSSYTNLFNFSIQVEVKDGEESYMSPWSAPTTVPAYCAVHVSLVYILTGTALVGVTAVLITLTACSVSTWLKNKTEMFDKVARELDTRFDGPVDIHEPEEGQVFIEEKLDLLPTPSYQGLEEKVLTSRSDSTSGIESGERSSDGEDAAEQDKKSGNYISSLPGNPSNLAKPGYSVVSHSPEGGWRLKELEEAEQTSAKSEKQIKTEYVEQSALISDLKVDEQHCDDQEGCVVGVSVGRKHLESSYLDKPSIVPKNGGYVTFTSVKDPRDVDQVPVDPVTLCPLSKGYSHLVSNPEQLKLSEPPDSEGPSPETVQVELTGGTGSGYVPVQQVPRGQLAVNASGYFPLSSLADKAIPSIV